MDGHSGIRELLRFLHRKVEYQKFVGVPPQETQHHHLNPHENNELFLQQHARACTTCFLFTDPEAVGKLLRPMIILVVDLSLSDKIALTIFRHSPDSNNRKSKKHHRNSKMSSLSSASEIDILNLCKQFETLSLADQSVSKQPKLHLLTGPIILSPNKESFFQAMKDVSRVVSDFSHHEFNTMIAIGGSGEGNTDIMSDNHFESDDSFLAPPSYPHGWTWNLLIFLHDQDGSSNSNASQRQHRLLSNRPEEENCIGPTFDLDNIPIIVHLGGGDFPSACGVLPTGLLMNGTWEDEKASMRREMTSPKIPRGLSFDLDNDAITDESDDDGATGDDAGGSMSDRVPTRRKKSKVASLSRKRIVDKNDGDTTDEDKNDLYSSSLTDKVQEDGLDTGYGQVLRSAMKRCRIEESGQSSSLSSSTSSNENSFRLKKNNGQSCGRARDEMEQEMEQGQLVEGRSVKRVYRGPSSFDRVHHSKPLATLIEGVPLVDSDISSLNYSLNEKNEEDEQDEEDEDNHGTRSWIKEKRDSDIEEAKRTIETTRGDEVLLDDHDRNQLSDGDDFALTKQISPKRKLFHSFERPPKRLSPLKFPLMFASAENENDIEGHGGGGTFISDSSPITSGEEESEEDESIKARPQLPPFATISTMSSSNSPTHVSSFIDGTASATPSPRAAEDGI